MFCAGSGGNDDRFIKGTQGLETIVTGLRAAAANVTGGCYIRK